MIFEIVIRGFCGGTDITDHLIKWIKADNMKVVNDFLCKYDLFPFMEKRPEDISQVVIVGKGDIDLQLPANPQTEQEEAEQWKKDFTSGSR